MCNDFSPAKTRQQTAKPQKKKKNKMFQFLGWMRKKFLPGNFC